MSPSASNSQPVIDTVTPPAAICGGDFEVRGRYLSLYEDRRAHAMFGSIEARLVVGGSNYAIVRVPDDVTESRMVMDNGRSRSEPHLCSVGLAIAENLHPVASPVVDREGNVFTTRSGARGETVPVSVFKIDLNFDVKPVGADIVNPTGLVFNDAGDLLVSSRNNGTIYMIRPNGETEIYAEGMGVATGLALDETGNLFVGDRTGTIFKISPERQIFVFATLEPSIAAYHLVAAPGGGLFVTGPTTSSFDSVYRVSSEGEVSVFYRGLGRPQGMAIDNQRRLYVAASQGGRKGIFRFTHDGVISQVVSGPGIVGLAFLPSGEMIVATGSSLYRISGSRWMEG
jgi:streptogramin lyase